MKNLLKDQQHTVDAEALGQRSRDQDTHRIDLCSDPDVELAQPLVIMINDRSPIQQHKAAPEEIVLRQSG